MAQYNMENSIYIYHHLGLGDHIMCNAIIRIYKEKYDKVFIFVKPNNLKNVSYMFRDLNNVKYIQMDMHDIEFFMKLNSTNTYLIVGHKKLHDLLKNKNETKTFDQIFYEMANVSFENKWDKFYFERDIEKEKDAFYNVLGLKDDEEFLFVHDNPEQNRKFKSSTIPPHIKIINPGNYLNVGFFDFIYTLEKAKQVHVMNSSFMNLIDCMQIKTKELFLHSYARTDMGDNPNPKLKLNWNILK